jgi:hypothetical protein
MYVMAIPNNRGNDNTYFCYLVESYRENGTSKHRILRNFGKVPAESVPYLKAAFAKKKPRLVYDE